MVVDNKIKVGVAGVGHLGKEHARIYSQLPSCNLIGIVDTNLKTAEAVSRKLGCQVFLSLEELAQSVDAVSVVVPTSLHYEVAQVFFGLGKDVFIEKPIVETTEQAEK